MFRDTWFPIQPDQQALHSSPAPATRSQSSDRTLPRKLSHHPGVTSQGLEEDGNVEPTMVGKKLLEFIE